MNTGRSRISAAAEGLLQNPEEILALEAPVWRFEIQEYPISLLIWVQEPKTARLKCLFGGPPEGDAGLLARFHVLFVKCGHRGVRGAAPGGTEGDFVPTEVECEPLVSKSRLIFALGHIYPVIARILDMFGVFTHLRLPNHWNQTWFCPRRSPNWSCKDLSSKNPVFISPRGRKWAKKFGGFTSWISNF